MLPISATATEYGSVTVDSIYSIYDADTFRVVINNWPKIIGKNISIRIKGIDAPEIRGKCEIEKQKALVAKQFTVQLLTNAKVIELRNIKRGKYFRILADVFVDGKNLAEMLINKKLVNTYNGGTREGWCSTTKI